MDSEQDGPTTPDDWGRTLRDEWEARASSEHRDHYIAAIPDYRNPAAWARQALIDANLVLHGIPREQSERLDVLDVGCGTGRLAPFVAPAVRSYTGIDISPSMIAEARRQHALLPRARFLVSDGVSLPGEAADREYGMAWALAVFIHCPLVVCEGLFRDVHRRLRPGGSLRGQVLADPLDLEGIDPGSQANMEIIHAQMAAAEVSAPPEERALIDGTHYTGYRFGFRELETRIVAAGYAAVQSWRFDHYQIYFSAQKAAAS